MLHLRPDLVRQAEIAAGLDRFRAESSVRTYLFAIAHNVLREYLRKRDKEAGRAAPLHSVADLGPSPSIVLAEHEQQRLLLHALRALPFDDQVVLELSFFEDMSRAQIAEVTGMPAGTVAGRLRRAKTQLQTQLEKLASDPAVLASTTTDLAHWAQSLREALMPDN